jgi:hypothetical protein
MAFLLNGADSRISFTGGLIGDDNAQRPPWLVPSILTCSEYPDKVEPKEDREQHAR